MFTYNMIERRLQRDLGTAGSRLDDGRMVISQREGVEPQPRAPMKVWQTQVCRGHAAHQPRGTGLGQRSARRDGAWRRSVASHVPRDRKPGVSVQRYAPRKHPRLFDRHHWIATPNRGDPASCCTPRRPSEAVSTSSRSAGLRDKPRSAARREERQAALLEHWTPGQWSKVQEFVDASPVFVHPPPGLPKCGRPRVQLKRRCQNQRR